MTSLSDGDTEDPTPTRGQKRREYMRDYAKKNPRDRAEYQRQRRQKASGTKSEKPKRVYKPGTPVQRTEEQKQRYRAASKAKIDKELPGYQHAARAKKYGVESESFSDWDLIARYGSVCYLCLEEIDMSLDHTDNMGYSRDHVTPMHLGGPNTMDNSRPTHLICNLRRPKKS